MDQSDICERCGLRPAKSIRNVCVRCETEDEEDRYLEDRNVAYENSVFDFGEDDY